MGTGAIGAAEHPGRVVLVDTDGSLQVEAVIGCGEPQLVVRAGVAYGARLTPASPRPVLELPAGPWRLTAGGAGTLDDVVVQPCARMELAAGQVRVAPAAVGVNFRDVLVALGMYPGGGQLGAEGAGVVVEVGPGVEGLAVGDAVMGLVGVVGSEAVVDARLVTAVPAGWSLVAAAGVPVVFLTAFCTGCRYLRAPRPGSGCGARRDGRGRDGCGAAGSALGFGSLRHRQPREVGYAARDGV